jgi:hypothetical protein
MRRFLLAALVAAIISPISAARAEYDSWGCGGIVANAGTSVEYPGATTVCTTSLPAGRQTLVLNWNRGAEGVVTAEVVAADDTQLAYAACGVTLGVPMWCYTGGPFDEASYVTIGAGSIGVTGFLGRLTVASDATVTLSVAPNGIGGSTPWATWAAGQFRVGAL